MRKLPQPLNVNEELMYCIAERLDKVIELLTPPVQMDEPVVVAEVTQTEAANPVQEKKVKKRG